MSTPRQLIDAAPISRMQIRILAILVAVAMAEGYDVLSMSLASVSLAKEWALSGTDVGMLLAAGPVGMAVGAIGLTRLADTRGRKFLIIVSLMIIAGFLLLSSHASTLPQLMAFRLLAGIGMGSLLPSATVLICEFAPARRRASTLGILAIGIPLGGAAGGAAGSLLMSHYGWQSLFIFGATITNIALTLVWYGVPESPEFLAKKDTEAARTKLNHILGQLAPPQPQNAPEPEDRPHAASRCADYPLWSAPTAMMCLLATLVNAVFYFANLWLPQLLVLAGMSANQGISGALLLSLGGAVGGILFALLATRTSEFRLTMLFLSSVSALYGAISFMSSAQLAPVMVISTMIGICMLAAATGMYALVPALFPAENRTAVMGLVMGISRIGPIGMPLLVGFLVDHGWTADIIFRAMIVPPLIAVVLTIRLRRYATVGAVGSLAASTGQPMNA